MFVHMFVHIFLHMFIRVSAYMFVHMPIHLSIDMSSHMSIDMSSHMSIPCPHTRLCTCPFKKSVGMSIDISVHISAALYTNVCIHIYTQFRYAFPSRYTISIYRASSTLSIRIRTTLSPAMSMFKPATRCWCQYYFARPHYFQHCLVPSTALCPALLCAHHCLVPSCSVRGCGKIIFVPKIHRTTHALGILLFSSPKSSILVMRQWVAEFWIFPNLKGTGRCGLACAQHWLVPSTAQWQRLY